MLRYYFIVCAGPVRAFLFSPDRSYWESIVTETKHTPDVWDSLSAILWWLVLLSGLFPEIVFFVLRELGCVTIHQAFTNTPWFITFSASGFVGWFTYQRCRECDTPDDMAFGKGIQTTLIALAAFLPLQIEQLPAYLHIPIPFYRYLILAVVSGKLLAWLYLVQLFMRYHLFSGLDVFRKMPLLSPSGMMHAKISEQKHAAPPL